MRYEFVALVDLTEKQWQSQVIELARRLGWNRVYHTHDSRRSAHGFPDLFLARPGDRAICLELKRERGARVTAEQAGWITDLLSCGIEAYLVRPSDLQPLAAVLSHRGDPRLADPGTGVYGAYRRLSEQTRREAA